MHDFSRSEIKEIINLKSFYFLNIDISLPIYVIDLKFSMSGPEVLPEGRVSQILVLGFGLDFM